MADPLKTPLEMFYRWEKETPDKVFLRQPKNLVWAEYTWLEVADQVRRIAAYLIEKGYEKGSRIGIWSANSKDWPIVDLAIQLSGHVSVPIYPGQDADSARYVFGHSETRLVFVGGIDQRSGQDSCLCRARHKHDNPEYRIMSSNGGERICGRDVMRCYSA